MRQGLLLEINRLLQKVLQLGSQQRPLELPKQLPQSAGFNQRQVSARQPQLVVSLIKPTPSALDSNRVLLTRLVAVVEEE